MWPCLRVRTVLLLLLAGALPLVPAAALAHGSEAPEPTATTLLTGWEFDPLFAIPMLIVTVAYWEAVRRVNASHPASPVPRKRHWYFAGGMVALLLALASPIATYDTTLFAAHMVQHILLTGVAAPLLLLSAPVTLLLRLLPAGSPRKAALAVLHSFPLKALAFPVLAWLVFTAIMWVSHFSGLFDGALENEWLHRLEHALYLGSALLFWWPVVTVDPGPWRLNHPLRLLYIFLQMPQNSFLAVAIASTDSVIFDHYASLVRTWGPSAQDDQEWAGNIMWVAGDFVFLTALAVVAINWLNFEQRKGERADRARDRLKLREAALARGEG